MTPNQFDEGSLRDIELERIQATQDRARELGRELLTPLAACHLFGKSPATVRRAVSEGHVRAQFTLHATQKPVSLLRLDSATGYWGPPDPHLVGEMRDKGITLAVDNGLSYNVLSPRPLVSLRNEGDMDP